MVQKKLIFHWLFLFFICLTLVFCDGTGGGGGGNDESPKIDDGISDDDVDYRAKAYDLVDQLYAANSSAEIEPILMEILTILGVPVYDHTDSPLITGSGSLTQGMALRD